MTGGGVKSDTLFYPRKASFLTPFLETHKIIAVPIISYATDNGQL
jgi:hypothetical protein